MKKTILVISLLLISACSRVDFQETVDLMNSYNAGVMSSLNKTTFVQTSKKKICVKYQLESGWSHGYNVYADIIDGNKLNTATGTYKYLPYSNYVVIFWKYKNATIIKLPLLYLSPIAQIGKDQQGRKWSISSGGVCY